MKVRISLLLLIFILLLTPFTVKAEKVYRGSADDQSITDIMNDYADGKYTTPDADVMKETVPKIQDTTGTIISVLLYLFFAFNVLTTVIDLAWIAIPPIRPFLYSPEDNKNNGNNIGQSNMQNNGFMNRNNINQ